MPLTRRVIPQTGRWVITKSNLGGISPQIPQAMLLDMESLCQALGWASSPSVLIRCQRLTWCPEALVPYRQLITNRCAITWCHSKEEMQRTRLISNNITWCLLVRQVSPLLKTQLWCRSDLTKPKSMANCVRGALWTFAQTIPYLWWKIILEQWLCLIMTKLELIVKDQLRQTLTRTRICRARVARDLLISILILCSLSRCSWRKHSVLRLWPMKSSVTTFKSLRMSLSRSLKEMGS